MNNYLPWIISASTIYLMVLTGNKHKYAWGFGLLVQLLWLIYIINTMAWGLLPMNIVLWFIYARNHIKWMNENKSKNLTISERYTVFD